jgi:citrate synthase
MSQTWPTSITKVEPNKLLLRGYRIDDLMGEISFAQVIFLALTGELPTEKQARLIDAILVSSIDHGVTPPSCQAARTATLTGSPLNAALAAGILAISRHHGGAIENCMQVLDKAVQQKRASGKTAQQQAQSTVVQYREKKRRIPGFGHRLHTRDPRAIKLFTLAHKLGFAAEHIEMAQAFEAAIERVLGRKLPLNVDGAIAAALRDLGIPPDLGNAFFMMARLPGLVAHIREERQRMKPMRHLDPKQHEYDGPPERKLNLQKDA